MPIVRSRLVERHAWVTLGATAALTAVVARGARRLWRHWRPASDRRDWTARHRLQARIAAEFTEMPGLSLTLGQACRLWGIAGAICERVLQGFVTEGILRRTEDGQFVRADAPA